MSSTLFQGNEYSVIFQILLLITSILAAICSIIVLYLIRKLNIKNGHMLLIKTMSWFQLLYDATTFTRFVNVGSIAVVDISFVLNIIGGLSGTFVSNVIAIIAYYVVTRIKSVPINLYYPRIMLAIAIPSLVTALLYIISCFPPYGSLQFIATAGMYYYMRLISIVFNFVLSFATIYQISRQSVQSNAPKSIHQEAIETLAWRLIYYPVVQTISRAAVAWYELEYNFNLSPTQPTANEFIGLCFVAIFTPSASFGYLCIFLLMQPNAWHCLKCLLCCRVYVPKRLAVVAHSPQQPRTSIIQMTEAETKNSLHSRNTGVSTLDSDNALHTPYDSGTTGSSASILGRLMDVDDDDLWFVVENNERFTDSRRMMSADRANSVGL